LVNQRVHDRDNLKFEVLKKKVILEAEAEAFGDARPLMDYGKKLVEPPKKMKKRDEDSHLKGVVG